MTLVSTRPEPMRLLSSVAFRLATPVAAISLRMGIQALLQLLALALAAHLVPADLLPRLLHLLVVPRRAALVLLRTSPFMVHLLWLAAFWLSSALPCKLATLSAWIGPVPSWTAMKTGCRLGISALRHGHDRGWLSVPCMLRLRTSGSKLHAYHVHSAQRGNEAARRG